MARRPATENGALLERLLTGESYSFARGVARDTAPAHSALQLCGFRGQLPPPRTPSTSSIGADGEGGAAGVKSEAGGASSSGTLCGVGGAAGEDDGVAGPVAGIPRAGA
jgi:hypothetical protein